MVRTLVAIEVDLASSFAIRYACQLGHHIEMEIHPIYVKFPSPEIPMPGVGWVRHTWEREVVETGKEEIQEMLASEAETCLRLQEPRVIYGDREIELFNVLEQETFDLYIEGAPYPFTPATIYKRLHAKSYQRLNCPLIWLRGVRSINRVVALCSDPDGAHTLVEALGRLFHGSSVPLSLAYAGDGGSFDMRPVAEKAVSDLAAQGCQVSPGEVYPLEAGPAPESLKDAGLVAVAVDKGIRKEAPLLQWLAGVKAPLLLVLR
jgi:hypothetical protein